MDGRLTYPRDSPASLWPWLCAAASLVILALLWVPVLTFPTMQVGGDYQTYMAHTDRCLAGGGLYPAYELEGPFPLRATESLFPPVALYLFVPFALLPDAVSTVLWYAIPAAIFGWALLRLRPKPIAWPVMALLASFPVVVAKVLVGSPTIWCAAAMAAGVVTVGPAVFVLLKPSLAPFALWGIRHRRWWLWLGAFALLCLPFGAMWLDYLTVLQNAQGASPLYSLGEAPLLLVPVVAWWLRDPVQHGSRAGQPVTAGREQADTGDGRRRLPGPSE